MSSIATLTKKIQIRNIYIREILAEMFGTFILVVSYIIHILLLLVMFKHYYYYYYYSFTSLLFIVSSLNVVGFLQKKVSSDVWLRGLFLFVMV